MLIIVLPDLIVMTTKCVRKNSCAILLYVTRNENVMFNLYKHKVRYFSLILTNYTTLNMFVITEKCADFLYQHVCSLYLIVFSILIHVFGDMKHICFTDELDFLFKTNVFFFDWFVKELSSIFVDRTYD